jgi:hypothetical protein
MAQSWNILTPAETKDAARVWLYQLKRHKVPTVYYQEILDRAIDHRIMHLAKGEKPPMLSVELLLAMFRELKADLSEQCQAIIAYHRVLRGLLANANEQNLNETQERQIIGKANELLRTEWDSIEAVRSGLKIVADGERREIEGFWRRNHLPEEAAEWLS